ncbi:MAG: ATP-binding protein [Arcobacter sp.]|nr:MAG: ATP-binding protein [Arcobacter sp.]
MFDKISTQANNLVSLTNRINSHSKTKVVVITSGKGGVGKSTLTANIAYLLSQKKKKIAVLDADIGLANLQVFFNLRPKKTYFDYLEGICGIEEILLRTNYNNITLIAGKSGYQYSKINNSMHFDRLVNDIISLNRYDILLVDTGAGLNEQVQEFLKMTDNILAVTTTDPSALTDVYALMKMISLKKNKLMLCFNFTAKYDIGALITKSLKNLALKNKLNRNFMVQYVGNISQTNSISTTSRLRKLFTKELSRDIASLELGIIVENLLKSLK